MYKKVLPQLWMLLPREQRKHLVTVFGIPHTGVSEVRNEEVISDGHTAEDLHAITAEKMALYVGYGAEYFTQPHPADQIPPSFTRLWELTVAKCHYELNPPIGTISGPVAEVAFDDTLAHHAIREDLSAIVDDTVTDVYVADIEMEIDGVPTIGTLTMSSEEPKPIKHAKKTKSK